jgi:hypothetical protein
VIHALDLLNLLLPATFLLSSLWTRNKSRKECETYIAKLDRYIGVLILLLCLAVVRVIQLAKINRDRDLKPSHPNAQQFPLLPPVYFISKECVIQLVMKRLNCA